MNAKILVVGSSNTDMVITTKHLPGPGETIMGNNFFMNCGGKGANQAVAAARLGGDITLVCKTGGDIFGKQSRDLIEKEGVDISYFFSDPVEPSGIALITVDEKAENCIVVASGANATLTIDDIRSCEGLIEGSDIILMQLEIPLETVQYVAETAFAKGKTVILNPAPACELPDSLLKTISIITPNETEAAVLSGIKIVDIATAEEAAKRISNRGVEAVIITMGGNGAVLFKKNQFTHIPAYRVNPVDTTAAGDIFNGALAIAISDGRTLVQAIAFACHASAISVTRMGAQSSAPLKHEVEAIFNNSPAYIA
jgi:ribokinase